MPIDNRSVISQKRTPPSQLWSLEPAKAAAVICTSTRLVSRAFCRRDVMPIYVSRGRFTSDAIKGMLAKPENREEAVAKLFKSVGGKLIGWYLTFGHHDWMAIGIMHE